MASFARRTPPPVRPTGLVSENMTDNYGVKLVLPEFNEKVRCKKPSWGGTETVIRPYPSLSYDNPDEFEPYRVDPTGSAAMGNWIRMYPCAWNVGLGTNEYGRRTFLVHDPFTGSVSLDRLPLNVLYKRIKLISDGKDAALTAKYAKFVPLVKGDSGGAAPISPIKSVHLIQGLLLVHGGKLKYGPDERGRNQIPLGTGDAPSCVFMISNGIATSNDPNAAGRILLNTLSEENEEHTDPYDFEKRYKCGDPVSLDHGRFFVFRQAGTPANNSFLARPNQQRHQGGYRNAVQQGRSYGGGKQDAKGFEVEVLNLPFHDGTVPVMNTPQEIEDVKQHWMYWEDILWFPTPIEQARELNEVFPPDVIVYGFEGCDPDWITDETWKKFKNRVTVQAATPALEEQVPSYGKRLVPPQRPQQRMEDPFGEPEPVPAAALVPPKRPSLLDTVSSANTVVYKNNAFHAADAVPTSTGLPQGIPDDADEDDAESLNQLANLINTERNKN